MNKKWIVDIRIGQVLVRRDDIKFTFYKNANITERKNCVYYNLPYKYILHAKIIAFLLNLFEFKQFE
jgi:hypothetical protein